MMILGVAFCNVIYAKRCYEGNENQDPIGKPETGHGRTRADNEDDDEEEGEEKTCRAVLWGSFCWVPF